MENNKLVRSNSGLAATGKSLLKPQEQSLLSELDLTATNSKTVLEPRLSAEFARVLADYPAEAIEAAFRGWRDVSPYFPAVSDIRQLCALWVQRKAEALQDEYQRLQQQELNAGRERGELIDFADIVKKLKEQCHDMPEPEPENVRRYRQVQQPLVNAAAPPIYMTPEEIAARRERERAEIASYAEQSS